MDEPVVIDFSELEGRVFTGRTRGEKLRERYSLNDVDLKKATVEVKIPSRVFSLTSSFFLGLFGPSVVTAGSKDEFFSRYHFDANPALHQAFADYVARALQDKRLFGEKLH